MADFEPIYRFTNLAEGGYQKMPEDSANYNSRGELVGTNHGIGAKTYEGYLGRVATEADMRSMSKATAKLIFKRNFWDPIQGDKIPSQAVAQVIFQEFIGSGYEGLRRVRKMINKVAGKKVLSEVAANFVNVPNFISILKSLNANELYQAIANNAIDTRFAIVKNSPSKSKFLTGWMNRWRKLDAKYTGNPLFDKRWREIDGRLKSMGLKPTQSILSSPEIYTAVAVGLGLLFTVGTFFF